MCMGGLEEQLLAKCMATFRPAHVFATRSRGMDDTHSSFYYTVTPNLFAQLMSKIFG